MTLPLSETRVLDFTRHLPGPYCTDLLRRLGAEVIKVEPPAGDPTRWIPPLIDGTGALFALVNGGKRSIVVDLKQTAGQEFARRLAAGCDVVVESYRPGVADQLGVGFEELSRLNPRLIYCSISGYGSLSPRNAHDLNFVALAGLLDLQRDESGRPVLPSTQIGDVGGALFGALSVVAALFERERTGTGRRIDISMSDATRAMMPAAESLYRGTHRSPSQFFLTGAAANYNIYDTADGKYLAVASFEPRFWTEFCQAVGHPELVPRLFDPAAHKEIQSVISAAILGKTRAEWEAIFGRIDVCVEPVLTIEEAHERFGDPILHHPLQTNFPSPEENADQLGGSVEAIAAEAGLDPTTMQRMREEGIFSRRDEQRQLFEKVNAPR